MSASRGIPSTPAPPGIMCSGASTCVPVCEPIATSDTLELPPRDMSCCSSMWISGFPGYTTPPFFTGTEISNSFRGIGRDVE